MSATETTFTTSSQTLHRRLGLTHLVLYGLGVTVGAGIYVLIGLTAAEAGTYAPTAFLLAALVVAFTGFSYAELTTRFPVSAGEAVYVAKGFGTDRLALGVGLLVMAGGLISSATISVGAGAYLSQLVPLPPAVLIAAIILGLGAIAAWGILQSVTFAAILTVLEIAGLALVLVYGVKLNPDILQDAYRLVPPLELEAWGGIAAAGLLAFFAFIGFEDLANIAEEAREPRKDLPRAILLTLLVATVLYLFVASVAVLSLPMPELAGSPSPLLLIFDGAPATARVSFNLIAAIATVNGVLVQMIMASRVLYGLADRGHLPARLAIVSPRTRTPLIATAIAAGAVLVFAFLLPLEQLAKLTSQTTLLVFMFVNAALIGLKRKTAQPLDAFTVPVAVPWIGLATCALLFLSGWM